MSSIADIDLDMSVEISELPGAGQLFQIELPNLAVEVQTM